jgi:DNA-binding NarL/FixJ family response regulator
MSVRVVLVDDHPLFRSGLRGALERAGGIEVVGEAGTVRAAVRVVAESAPDVVVLDMNLPDGSGVEVARALVGAVRVLALSAHDDAAYVQGLLDAGAGGYVTKDQHPAVIREAILAVHRGEGRWFVPLPRTPQTLSPLTGREHEVLILLARGLEIGAIGERLRIAENTVRNHLASIYGKLGVSSAREAAVWAWENGLVRAEP